MRKRYSNLVFGASFVVALFLFGRIMAPFLMPVLIGQLLPGEHRSTWEQPASRWVDQVAGAGFVDIDTTHLFDYWSSPAFLLTAGMGLTLVSLLKEHDLIEARPFPIVERRRWRRHEGARVVDQDAVRLRAAQAGFELGQ